MTKITRRRFLRTLAGSLGAVAAAPLLAACEQQATTPPPTPPPSPATPPPQPSATPFEPLDTAAPAPTAIPTEPPTPAPVIPDLAVVRYGEPEDMVRRAVAALGGMERFVPKGAKVIVKPNICVAYHSYEYAATTNPWVVGALVKLCLEAGAASVSVLDFPFGGSPDDAYRASGIGQEVEAAGGKMTSISWMKFVKTDVPKGKSLKSTEIYDDILKADAVIDVPIAKHHGSARLTLGMKNLLGVIADRGAIHQNLGQRIADLTTAIYPTLTVVDGVRILTNNGPSGGSLNDVKKMDTIIASPDVVAADSYAAQTLFGMDPQKLDYIRAAIPMNLGRADLENLNIAEINL